MIEFLILGSILLMVGGGIAMVLERTGVGKPQADTLTHRQSPSDHPWEGTGDDAA